MGAVGGRTESEGARAEPAREERAGVGRGQDPAAFEDYPLQRTEYINALIHLYRGELNRANAWRQRSDQTTNWAVVLLAGLFSFTFGTPQHHHVTLLIGHLLVGLMLFFEARRYQRYDAWYARVRILEENFYIPILRRDLISPKSRWRFALADDLMSPRYKMTLFQALRFRLSRNYVWLFLICLVGWVGKLAVHPVPAERWEQLWERAAVGPLGGGAVVAGIGAFYAVVLAIVVLYPSRKLDREMNPRLIGREVEEWADQ